MPNLQRSAMSRVSGTVSSYRAPRYAGTLKEGIFSRKYSTLILLFPAVFDLLINWGPETHEAPRSNRESLTKSRLSMCYFPSLLSWNKLPGFVRLATPTGKALQFVHKNWSRLAH